MYVIDSQPYFTHELTTVAGAYANAAGVSEAEGATTAGFTSSFAFFLLWMGVL
jgi:hypothetical protein